jgi:hypothetical protein
MKVGDLMKFKIAYHGTTFNPNSVFLIVGFPGVGCVQVISQVGIINLGTYALEVI